MYDLKRMLRIKRSSLAFLALLSCLSIFSQPAIGRSVTSGLRVRSLPSLGGAVLAKLALSEEVVVLGRAEEAIVVDGLSGYWLVALTMDGVSGWLFSGYMDLVDGRPDDLSILASAPIEVRIKDPGARYPLGKFQLVAARYESLGKEGEDILIGALGAFLKLPDLAARVVFSDYFGNDFEGSTALSGIEVVDLVGDATPEVLVTHRDEGYEAADERLDIYSMLNGSSRFTRIGSMNTSSQYFGEGPGRSRILMKGPEVAIKDGKRFMKMVYQETGVAAADHWETELYSLRDSWLSLESSVASDGEAPGD